MYCIFMSNVKIYLQNIIALFLPFCLWGEVFFSLSLSFLFIYLFYCTLFILAVSVAFIEQEIV